MNRLQQQLQRLKDRGYKWPVPWEVVEMMGTKENCKLAAYLCPAGVWTIGWGETAGVTQGMRWTEEQADETFFKSVSEYTEKVRAMLSAPANENELGAMVSLAYNIGLGAHGAKGGFYASSIRRLHNAGDKAGASRAFHLYNKAKVNGVLTELRGLVARRAAESALYLRPPELGDDEAFEEAQVQQVERESSLVASPINLSAVGVATVGAVQLASEMSATVKPVVEQAKEVAAMFNIEAGLVLSALLLSVAATLAWNRWKQRRGGWA